MKDSKKIIRRRHHPDLKARILSECEQPGASVESVAMSHGINANVVHNVDFNPNLTPPIAV